MANFNVKVIGYHVDASGNTLKAWGVETHNLSVAPQAGISEVRPDHASIKSVMSLNGLFRAGASDFIVVSYRNLDKGMNAGIYS